MGEPTVLYTFSIVSLLLFIAILLSTQPLQHGRTKLSTAEEDGFELHTAADHVFCRVHAVQLHKLKV